MLRRGTKQIVKDVWGITGEAVSNSFSLKISNDKLALFCASIRAGLLIACPHYDQAWIRLGVGVSCTTFRANAIYA